MRLSFVAVCMLGACIARADVYYDFETAATSPVWLGTTQMIQNTSASHQGTNAIAFTGGPYGGSYAPAYILTELPQNTTNVEFYFCDDYGPNPPLYQYMHFLLLEATNSTGFAGFSMLDAGWGTTPPETENHYYAWGHEDYNAANMGPIRTVGWHKFTFAIGAESVAMSVDDTLVFQTNMIQTARYLEVSLVTMGWGRMDDLYISTGTGPCVPPPSGLVSWWQAEGNANDTVDGNSGVLLNGATFAPGRVGQAFSFDGTNSYARISDNPNLHFTNALTIEAWIYPTSLGAYHNIVSKWGVQDPLQTSYTTVVGPDGRISLSVCASGDQSVTPVVNTVSTNSVLPNQWTHFAATYDGSALRMYLNGVCEDQVAYNQGIFPGTEALAIGAAGAYAGGQVLSPFAGLIDEPAVYNRALSGAEIQGIYNAGSAGKCVPPVITSQPTNFFVLAGSDALFSAAATGTQPLSYQWALNGTLLPGATNTMLSLSNVSGLNAGFYTMIVSNLTGSVTSTPALLDVRYALAYGNGGLLPGSNYTFIGSVGLQLWSVFPNANIFYTLDSSEPSFESSYYAGPFNLSRSATLRVIAYSADFLQAAEAPPIYITVIPTYGLNLTSPGGGTITASPPAGPYVSNSVVTLTPQPSNGWTFLEWRGDASGTSPTVDLTMNRAKSVQAIFGTTLGTTVAGNGAVNVYPALPLYPYSTVARLTAIPQAGSYFAVWGNAASGNTNPLYFTVTSAAPIVSSLFATLGATQHALTVIPDGFGSVTITPQANVYTTGASATLNAMPDPGQQFLAWSGDATGSQNPLAVTMNTSKTITATFTRKPSLTVAPPLDGLFEDCFRLTLKGELGQAYRINASTNLVNWAPVTILTNAYGTVQLTDPIATNTPYGFYRAVSAP